MAVLMLDSSVRGCTQPYALDVCVSLYVSVSAPFHINKLTSINCLFALGNLQVFSFCVCVCISDSP